MIFMRHVGIFELHKQLLFRSVKVSNYVFLKHVLILDS